MGFKIDRPETYDKIQNDEKLPFVKFYFGDYIPEVKVKKQILFDISTYFSKKYEGIKGNLLIAYLTNYQKDLQRFVDFAQGEKVFVPYNEVISFLQNAKEFEINGIKDIEDEQIERIKRNALYYEEKEIEK